MKCICSVFVLFFHQAEQKLCKVYYLSRSTNFAKLLCPLNRTNNIQNIALWTQRGFSSEGVLCHGIHWPLAHKKSFFFNRPLLTSGYKSFHVFPDAFTYPAIVEGESTLVQKIKLFHRGLFFKDRPCKVFRSTTGAPTFRTYDQERTNFLIIKLLTLNDVGFLVS